MTTGMVSSTMAVVELLLATPGVSAKQGRGIHALAFANFWAGFEA